MLTSFIRTVILYFFLTVVIRLMGKRQIAQLQPGELVITIMLSEIAAIPMQDNDTPLLNSVIAVLLLASFEIIMSVVSMKSIKARNLLQGNPVVIIRDGVIDQKLIKDLRYTVDDILEALRQKDIFDISTVQYAIAETNGVLSVMKKPNEENVTRKDLNLPAADEGMPCVVVSDGRIIKTDFPLCSMNEQKLKSTIKSKKTSPDDILLMTATKSGKINIIKKERDKQ